ncbi:MAG: hypothetical protein Kow0090_10780 [Myxococcota bacterium]
MKASVFGTKLWAVTLFFTAVFAVVLSGCRPDFPECRDDEDCQAATDQNEGRFLFCVDKQCQECRDAADCKNGWLCKNYRCEPECRTNADCSGGFICRNYKCQPECLTSADCSPGNKCENQRCVPDVECAADADCPEGKACKRGKCVVAEIPQCSLDTINFDFDKYAIRPDAARILEANAKCIKSRTDITTITIEGHCDERGTTEYNLSLGEKRANATRRYLMDLGVDGRKLKTISYGEERPADPRSNEDAWAKNRRSEFVINR